jgi:hypothetical protein
MILCLEEELARLEADVAAAEARLADTEARLAPLAPLADYLAVDVQTDRVAFVGANVYVQAGTSGTFDANGVGNLVVGYDESNGDTRTGSHNVVVGRNHSYDGASDLIVGADHDAYSGSVVGGQGNSARAWLAVVSGGRAQIASGEYGVASGGYGNRAGERYDWQRPTRCDAVSGGASNTATGSGASISGGSEHLAVDRATSISGGLANLAGYETHPLTDAMGDYAAVSGGTGHRSLGTATAIQGGVNTVLWASYAYAP